MGSRRASIGIAIVLALCLLAHVPSPVGRPGDAPPSPDAYASASPIRAQVLESAFAENRGQVGNPDILFYAHSGRVAFMRGSVALYAFGNASGGAAQGRTITLRFVGANSVDPVGLEPAPWASSYFLGGEPDLWCTGVANYREVVYENLWDGIGLRYYMGEGGLKYDFMLAPGINPDIINILVQGHTGLRISEDDALAIGTGLGPGSDIIDSAPAAFYADGGRETVPARFRLLAGDSYAFEIGARDVSRPLVIDPLIYSTFLGGGDSDSGLAVAAGGDGCAYVTGETFSPGFPTSPGSFDIIHGGVNDVFVAKLAPDGDTLLYSAFLGGAGYDVGRGIAVDGAGCAYVTGETFSSGFPTTQAALARVYGGSGDAFAAKLGPNGDSLMYSTYLGGLHDDIGHGIAVDGFGHAHVTGRTWSGAFPTTEGAHSAALAGDSDIFVTKLDPNGASLLYSTFVGGTGSDQGLAIALDGAGRALVTGSTSSDDFPITPGALDAAANGTESVFVLRLSTGGSLALSARLGGTGSDRGLAIAADAEGHAYLAGMTSSSDFPVTGQALGNASAGGADAFVAKLNGTGGSLVYSMYLGGSKADAGLGIAVDAEGCAHVTGHTGSADFPITAKALDATFNGNRDAFLAKISPAGTHLAYSSFLGGAMDDWGHGLALAADGSIFVAGETHSPDFPVTASALQPSHAGGADAFLMRFDISIPIADAGPDLVVNESAPVRLNGTASWDNVGIVNYTWTFSDGLGDIELHGPAPTHAFTVPGHYSIQLNVSDTAGNWNTDAMNLTVLLYPLPTAVVGPDLVVNQSEPVRFDGTASRDSGGIASYLWTFDDGLNNVTLGGAAPSWAFTAPGTYPVTLTVEDGDGNTHRAFMTVTVLDITAPVAIPMPTVSLEQGGVAKLDGSASRDNVGVANYTWEFAHNGSAVTLYGLAPEFRFWSPGTHSVTLTVEDAAGNRASNVVAVTVIPTGEGGGVQPPYLMIIGIAALSAVLLAIVLLRRKKAAEPPGGEQ